MNNTQRRSGKTPEKFKSYRFLLGEIVHDRARLKQLEIKAESGEESLKPLIHEYCCKIFAKKERAARIALEICEFIESCPNSQVRDILALRYIDGCTWRKVAYKLGGGNTEDSVRKIAIRYFSKNPL